MLRHLYIKNYALIEELDIDFTSGFSVITGETGAGKSIILGAISLLLGQRADPKAVKRDSQKCTVEALFDISHYGLEPWFEENGLDCEAPECIIRRELTAAGKSRAFINDTPATLQQMRELGERLVDVHSQHQNLLLRKEDFQLGVLDIMANNAPLRQDYARAYHAWREAQGSLEAMKEAMLRARENEDFMRFQYEELSRAALRPGEQEELEQEQASASHTEEIKASLYEAAAMLDGEDQGVLPLLRQAAQRLASAASLLPRLQPLAERMESALIEVKDISGETMDETERIDFDPERLAYVNERLDTIYSLLRKHQRADVAELLELQASLEQAIDSIAGGDEALREQEALAARLRAEAGEKARKLSETRRRASDLVARETAGRLAALGMPNAELTIEMEQCPLAADGTDSVSYLFTANRGMPPRPVAQVASGGETARLMLSLKAMISGAAKLPTIIFDEIDTGVSGRVAEQMAGMMREMGRAGNRQVISITHLPQIAAMGTSHYRVEKREGPQGTTTSMRLLSSRERTAEIAQMLSGADVTEAALTNAAELLAKVGGGRIAAPARDDNLSTQETTTCQHKRQQPVNARDDNL